MLSTELSIQCWNINGVFKNVNGFRYNKLHEPEFIGQTRNVDILGLVETQHTSDDYDELQIESYKCFPLCRKKLRQGRKHGGIAAYVHLSVAKGVTRVPTPGSDAIVLKLDRVFFRQSKDVYLIFSYCSPANSSFTIRTESDPISGLEEIIASLGPNTDTLLFGDLNARTGLKFDYIKDEENTNLILSDNYEVDTVATFQRGNKDPVTNKYGEQLVSLCKSVPLRICNGRKLGDTLGNYTCHKWNGQSTVDYCLASPSIYSQISFLKVGKFYPLLSDHCPLSAALKCRFLSNQITTENYCFIPKPVKLAWDKNIALKFENVIQSEESKAFLKNFAANGFKSDQKSIDTSTSFLTDFLVNAAETAANNGIAITLLGKPAERARNWKFIKKSNRKIVKPKWHDSTCESLRKDIKNSAALLKIYPNNSYLRGRIQAEAKKYKRLIKSRQKEYIDNLF